MATKSILINGVPFTYEDEKEDITYENIKPISEEDARCLLDTTKRLFNQCGLSFVLAYGTLLGAIRDHGLIKGDTDVDVYVDSEEKLRQSLPFLQENGLRLCRIYENALYSFRLNDRSFIDVYIHRNVPDGIWGKWYDIIEFEVIPKSYLREVVTYDFLGGTYLIPKEYIKLLRHWYGNTWRTPIPNYYDNSTLVYYSWWKQNKWKGCLKLYSPKLFDWLLNIKTAIIHNH